jgi:hypothetical protein
VPAQRKPFAALGVRIDPGRWLVMTAALTLMVMLAGVFVISFAPSRPALAVLLLLGSASATSLLGLARQRPA